MHGMLSVCNYQSTKHFKDEQYHNSKSKKTLVKKASSAKCITAQCMLKRKLTFFFKQKERENSAIINHLGIISVRTKCKTKQNIPNTNLVMRSTQILVNNKSTNGNGFITSGPVLVTWLRSSANRQTMQNGHGSFGLHTCTWNWHKIRKTLYCLHWNDLNSWEWTKTHWRPICCCGHKSGNNASSLSQRIPGLHLTNSLQTCSWV